MIPEPGPLDPTLHHMQAPALDTQQFLISTGKLRPLDSLLLLLWAPLSYNRGCAARDGFSDTYAPIGHSAVRSSMFHVVVTLSSAGTALAHHSAELNACLLFPKLEELVRAKEGRWNSNHTQPIHGTHRPCKFPSTLEVRL